MKIYSNYSSYLLPTHFKPCLKREKYILRVKVHICYLLLRPTPCFPQSGSFHTAQFYVGVVLKVLLTSGLLVARMGGGARCAQGSGGET